ncbi:MAG: AAA family ATPase, partial [Candidatus Poribacteria bacterium]
MRTSKSKSLRFTRIHLENWRNFTLVDVDIQRRVFLVGPNASGKSNLLDVFRFLYDIVSIGGGFQEAVRNRGGVSKLRCLAARRYSDIVIHVDIGDDDNKIAWEYEIRFTQDKLRIPTIKQEIVKNDGETIINRPDSKDKKDDKRLTQTHLEQVFANEEFREIADFLLSIRYLHIVPQLVREPDRLIRGSDSFGTYFGADFLEKIAKTTEKTKESRMKFLNQAMQIAVPQLKNLELIR